MNKTSRNMRILRNNAYFINRITYQKRLFGYSKSFGEKKSDKWDYLTAESTETSIETPTKTSDESAELENDDLTVVSRPLHSNNSEITSTEKERMIFSKIFDSILTQKAESTSSEKHAKPIASSLKALFEESTNDQNKSNVNLETGWKPMKSLSNTWNENNEKLLEQHKKVQKYVEPVLDHIKSFQYDYQLVDYYNNKILNGFIPEKAGAPIPSEPIKIEKPELIGTSLPIYLLECMKILVKDFKDPSQAISLFELSKRHSIEFYAHSCTADVYNFVMELRWDYYRDLYAVETVLSEMQVNAVSGNVNTVDLLSRISRDSVDAKHGMLGSNNTALWNREDEQRIQKLGQYKLRILSAIPPTDPMTIPLRFNRH